MHLSSIKNLLFIEEKRAFELCLVKKLDDVLSFGGLIAQLEYTNLKYAKIFASMHWRVMIKATYCHMRFRVLNISDAANLCTQFK